MTTKRSLTAQWAGRLVGEDGLPQAATIYAEPIDLTDADAEWAEDAAGPWLEWLGGDGQPDLALVARWAVWYWAGHHADGDAEAFRGATYTIEESDAGMSLQQLSVSTDNGWPCVVYGEEDGVLWE